MSRIKVGINGFGRIGRAFARIALMRDTFDIVAVNTRKTPVEMLAYLLQYDSVYRRFSKAVSHEEGALIVDGKRIVTTMIPDITAIPWEAAGVDLVVDATGAFKTVEDLEKHVRGSVKKVVLTAPAGDDMQHVVCGVNSGTVDFNASKVISNASCTTNCAAPMFEVLEKNFGVETGFLTTVHAYTQSQSLTDDPGHGFADSRAAALNTIPSTTGAAKAVARVIPSLKGKIDGIALRVPVPTGSFTDISVVVRTPVTAEQVNAVFKAASENELKGILGYTTDVIVSSDIIGSPFSCVFDSNYTKVMPGNFLKVFGWYDNEWGYSTRLVDLVDKIAAGL